MFVFGYIDMGRLGSRARLLVMVLTVRKGTPPSGKRAEQQAINGIKLLWVTLLCINIYVFYYSGGKPVQMSDWAVGEGRDNMREDKRHGIIWPRHRPSTQDKKRDDEI